MEDISRKLEREIDRSKPKPYKQNLKSKLIIIDDFGMMKSGNYFKILVKFLSFTTVICFVAALVLYYLYTTLLKESVITNAKLENSQISVNNLIKEKEMLMAKLVISGKKPDIVSKPLAAQENQIKSDSLKSQSASKPATKKIKTMSVKTEKQKTPLPIDEKQKNNIGSVPTNSKIPESVIPVKPNYAINKTVTIENFVVKRAGSKKTLLVRFDIKKIAKTNGDVSGRIFTVLLPEDSASQEKWLVVPSSSLTNGIMVIRFFFPSVSYPRE